jgi:hypothetical protein
VDEILLAALIKKVEERLENMPIASRLRGPRGHVGPPGKDGKDFVLFEHEETLRNWSREIAMKFEDFTAEQISQLRGPRGQEGKPGRDGKDFSPEEWKSHWEELAQKFALKFEDFTTEQISQLRGPSGRNGKDGRDGKDFSAEEHREEWACLAQSAALKFEDFTAEQIAQLRGPKGRDGRDGKDFSWEEYETRIQCLCRELVVSCSEILRLKFSDLSSEEIEQLRGPRGRDGRDGKNFDFEEHRSFFESLKPRFSDFTADEKESLRLKFSDLTEEEKSSLKLRFEDLSEDDKISIRGARGKRGQIGKEGPRGEKGDKGDTVVGPRGLPGVTGPRGFSGVAGADGRDGKDGRDAPYVTDIHLEEIRGEIHFVFDFSDGTYIETESVPLPHQTWTVAGGGFSGGGGSGGGGGIVPVQENGTEIVAEPSALNFTGAVTVTDVDGVATIDVAGTDGKSAYEVAVDEGFEGTVEEWLESLKGADGDPGPEGPMGPVGIPDPEGTSIIENNQTSETEITTMTLPAGKSWWVHIYVERTTDEEEIYATELWLVTKLATGHRLTQVVGDESSGLVLTIGDTGKFSYTSSNQSGTVDTQKINWKFETIIGDDTEDSATIENDQATATDVDGMIAGPEKSQFVHYYIERDVDSDAVMADWATLDSLNSLDEVQDIRQTGIAMVTRTQFGHCRLTPMFDDGMAGVTLSILDSGQFQYVSTDVGGDFMIKKIHWKFFNTLVG